LCCAGGGRQCRRQGKPGEIFPHLSAPSLRRKIHPAGIGARAKTANDLDQILRLFGPIGRIPPAEAEANYYAASENLDMVA